MMMMDMNPLRKSRRTRLGFGMRFSSAIILSLLPTVLALSAPVATSEFNATEHSADLEERAFDARFTWKSFNGV